MRIDFVLSVLNITYTRTQTHMCMCVRIQEHFGSEGCASYVGCGDGITGIVICPNPQDVLIKCVHFLCIIYTSIQLKNIKNKLKLSFNSNETMIYPVVVLNTLIFYLKIQF